MKAIFYKCPVCGNVVIKTIDSGVPLFCCGKQMEELKPNTVDVAREKHVPVVTRVDDCTLEVNVGSLPHPMVPEHSIRFIWLETANGGQLRVLSPLEAPQARFCGCKDPVEAVYEFCNLHGLWMTDAIPAESRKCCCTH